MNGPLWSGVSAVTSAKVERDSVRRTYVSGETIFPAGEPGRALFTILSGLVLIQPASTQGSPITLGPGETFGELSLLTGAPTSASAVGYTACEVLITPAALVRELTESDLGFLQGLTKLLASQLRQRTFHGHELPIAVFVQLTQTAPESLPHLLKNAVGLYATVSERSFHLAKISPTEARRNIDRWRATGVHEVCFCFGTPTDVASMRDLMRPDDVVLLVDDSERRPPDCSFPAKVHVSWVRIGRATTRPGQEDEAWSWALSDEDLAPESALARSPSREKWGALARWLTRRSIGIALGAGGARGFAHLGVLLELDRAGIPLDFLVGSSIGGIIAMMYGRSLSAQNEYEALRVAIGSNKIVRELSLMPTRSLFRGRRIKHGAYGAVGRLLLRDLLRPAKVVATDLISGLPVVIDCGYVSTASLATAAIPGIFPMVERGSECLVDGALSSPIPVHLLAENRCGFKIAVDVAPDLGEESLEARERIRKGVTGRFSIASILSRAWEMSGSPRAHQECSLADVVIKPNAGARSSFDFDAVEYFVSAGRTAANLKLPELLHLTRAPWRR